MPVEIPTEENSGEGRYSTLRGGWKETITERTVREILTDTMRFLTKNLQKNERGSKEVI